MVQKDEKSEVKCKREMGGESETKFGICFQYRNVEESRIWYMFSISKCRGKSDSSLCMTSVLAKRMLLRSADFRRMLRLVCISVVIELLAVWRHNKPKTKRTGQTRF